MKYAHIYTPRVLTLLNEMHSSEGILNQCPKALVAYKRHCEPLIKNEIENNTNYQKGENAKTKVLLDYHCIKNY